MSLNENEILVDIPFKKAVQCCILSLQALDSFIITKVDDQEGKVVAVTPTPPIATLISFYYPITISFIITRKGISQSIILVKCSNKWGSDSSARITQKISSFFMEKKYLEDKNIKFSRKLLTNDIIGKEMMNITPGRNALNSLLMPGSGQVNNNQIVKGFTFLVSTAIGLLLFVLPGFIIWAIGIYETYRSTKKINEIEGSFRETNHIINSIYFFGGMLFLGFVFLFLIKSLA
jgi:hypothetical protein